MGTQADATTNEHGCWPNAGVKIKGSDVDIVYQPSESGPEWRLTVDKETAKRLGGILTTLPDEVD